MIIRRIRPDAKIVTVLNGLEAVHYFERPESDLPEFVFLDINMPIMNGFEFLNWLDARPEKPKVIMYTSSVRDEDRKEATRHPEVVAYVEKPLSNATFEAILKEPD